MAPTLNPDMTIKVFSFTSDEHSAGTSTSVHATKAALDKVREGIITARLDLLGSDVDALEERTVNHLRGLIEDGDIDEAWTIYCDGAPGYETLKPGDDNYWWEEHEIELPISDRDVAIILGALRLTERFNVDSLNAMPQMEDHPEPIGPEEIDGLCERLNFGK